MPKLSLTHQRRNAPGHAASSSHTSNPAPSPAASAGAPRTAIAVHRALLAAALALASTAAQACTLCHTPTAREVRHAVFGHDFAANLMSVALPLPLLLGAIYLVGLERRPARGPKP